MKEMSDLIYGKAAVGGNYNSTRDTVFSRFSNIPDSMTTWVGRHHSVFLYEIDSELRVRPEIIQQEGQKTRFKLVTQCDSDENSYKYVAISFFSLSNEYSSGITDFDMAIKRLRTLLLEKIDEILDEYRAAHSATNIKLQYEVYGCFNTSEIAVLWSAEQYCDILQIIDQIKYLKVNLVNERGQIPIFFNVYSIFSRDQINTNYDEETERKGRGVALLQLVVNNESAFPEVQGENLKKVFAEELEKVLGSDYEKCEIMCGAGEYDMTIRMPSKYAYNLFLVGDKNKRALFNRKNRFANLVIKTRVYLGYTDEECNEGLAQILQTYTGKRMVLTDNCITRYMSGRSIVNAVQLRWELAQHVKTRDGQEGNARPLYDIYRELRKNVKEICPKTVGAVDTLDGLFTDYLSNIQACYNVLWRNDFHYQFKKTIEFLLLFSRCYKAQKQFGGRRNEIRSQEFWAIYSEMINNLHQQIVHISQANRMFLRIPASNLLYTGNYDFLLHAYYGIIKEILEYAYSLDSDLQAEIAPLITVNIAPHVESRRYSLMRSWLPEEDQGRKNLCDIIRLYIPHSLLTEPERGYYYIIHELFHYIAPPDRTQRNNIVNELVMKEIITVHFCDLLCEEVVAKILDQKYLAANEKKRFFKALGIAFESEESMDKQIEDLSNEDIKSIRYVVARVLEQIKQVVRPIVCGVENEKDGLLLKLRQTIYNKQGEDEKRSFLYDIEIVKNEFQKVSRGELAAEYKKICTAICVNCAALNVINNILQTGNTKVFGGTDKIILDVVGKILQNDIFVIDSVNTMFNEICTEGRDEAEDTIINGIREAVPDLCMCRIGMMSPPDYVMHFVRNQIDLMKNKSDVQVFLDHDVLRVFSVTEYLLFSSLGEIDRETYLEKDYLVSYMYSRQFENAFVDLFLAEHASLDQMQKEQYGRTKDNALHWLSRVQSMAVRYYQCYDCYREIFLNLFESYDPVMRQTETAIGFASQMADCAQKKLQFGESIRNEDDPGARKEKYIKFQEEYFDIVLAVTKRYIVQPTFFDVEYTYNHDKPNRKKRESASGSMETEIGSMRLPCDVNLERSLSRRVYTENEFFHMVEMYADFLNEGMDDCDRVIWYRGQENSEYILLPSLFRRFNGKMKEKCVDMGRLQRRNFENFKVRLEGAHEMTHATQYALADYIAFMQHYEKPTNFLDWSDNLMTALYFALEPLTDPSKQKTLSTYASLYLFSPYKYNQARCDLQNKYGGNTENRFSVIPNLTVPYNEQLYDAYLLNIEESHMASSSKALEAGDIAPMLPLAITTSRINSRINRQEGSFVAFHLGTPRDEKVVEEPSLEFTKAFDYISLENIQTMILKMYRDDFLISRNELLSKAFLFKIDIEMDILGRQLAKLLHTIGVQKGTIYPEPNNWKI
ncbi:MAG: FRG domain-containing protein [Eubacterium sp.]|nr:FRG domain-containing protein [Eubacterium sp.]